MATGREGLCLADIQEAIKIINNLRFTDRVNKNVRTRTFVNVPYYNKMVAFVVINVRVNLNGIEYPAEYALYFDGRDHKIKLRNNKIICNLSTLEKFIRYLR